MPYLSDLLLDCREVRLQVARLFPGLFGSFSGGLKLRGLALVRLRTCQYPALDFQHKMATYLHKINL